MKKLVLQMAVFLKNTSAKAGGKKSYTLCIRKSARRWNSLFPITAYESAGDRANYSLSPVLLMWLISHRSQLNATLCFLLWSQQILAAFCTKNLPVHSDLRIFMLRFII